MAPVRLDDLIDGIHSTYPNAPLEQLTAAVLVGEQLSDVADHLVGHFVDQARHSGASWTEIGGCLGVTKQAAQKRFVAKDDLNMFTRFNSKARQAVMLAMDEARGSRSAEVHAEHLLLGMLGVPDCMAVLALRAQGVADDRVRRSAAKTLSNDATEPPAMIPYAESAKTVLVGAVGQAQGLGHDFIGTEHLLLALLDPTTGPATLARRLAVDAAAVRSYALEQQAAAL